MAVAPLIAAGVKSASTAAVTSAAIGAGSRLAGGYLQHRGNSNAQKAQLKANQDAINYQRQREAEQQNRLRAYNDEYKKAYLDWYGRVGDEGLKRFGAPPVGVRLPGPGGQQTRSGGPVRMEGSSSPVAPLPAAPMAAAPAPLGGGAGVPPLVPTAQPATPEPETERPGQPRANLGGWNDWTQYGA